MSEEEKTAMTEKQIQAVLYENHRMYKAKADIFNATASILYMIVIFGLLTGSIGVFAMFKWAWHFGG